MNPAFAGMPPEPFELISCSWPRPVARDSDRWISEPDWHAPLFPAIPRPRWISVENALCWTIDWREFFDGSLKRWTGTRGGEMRNFHVVFRVRINVSGRLRIWDDDGSVLRRHGRIIREDRSMHPMTRSEIEAEAGDIVEIAQWQSHGGWLWGVEAWCANLPNARPPLEIFEPFIRAAEQRLLAPAGPALKVFCSGASPVRTALCIHSFILNGCPPREVLLFGEHQWSESSRSLLRALLPFARVIPTADFLRSVAAFGSPQLAEWARDYWFVMKTCAALLHAPPECSLMDDDVFVLGPVDDAIGAFGQHDLVYSRDADHGRRYLPIWAEVFGVSERLPTGAFNAGLYWLRAPFAPRDLVQWMLRADPRNTQPMDWEQGFIASLFARHRAFALPGERYFYPYYDGLPGGFLGYDYLSNPCGFASLHFGGLAEKPSECDALLLARPILSRSAPVTSP